MKKLVFGLIATVMFSFMSTANVNSINPPKFKISENVKFKKFKVCVGVGYFSACTDIDISCSSTGCTISWGKIQAEQNPKDDSLFIKFPKGTDLITEFSVLEDAQFLDEKGGETGLFMKKGSYKVDVKNQSVTIETFKK